VTIGPTGQKDRSPWERDTGVFILQITRGHVVHAGIAEDVLTDVGVRGRLVAGFSDDDSKLGFVVHALRNLRTADHAAGASNADVAF